MFLQTIRLYYRTCMYRKELRKLLRDAEDINILTFVERFNMLENLGKLLSRIKLEKELRSPADWFDEFYFKTNSDLLYNAADVSDSLFFPRKTAEMVSAANWLDSNFNEHSLYKQNLILKNLGRKIEKILADRTTQSDKEVTGRKLTPALLDLLTIVELLFDLYSIGETK